MKPWLVAHRGAPHEAKENTHAAFAAAKQYMIAFIEFDVRITKDNIAIIHHDPFIGDLMISNHTYRELVAIEDDVAKFEDVIANNTEQPLIVELKSEKSAQHTTAYLQAHTTSFATSFLSDELCALKEAGIAGERLLLAQHYHPFGIIKRTIRSDFGGITIQKWFINPFLYHYAQKRNLKVMVYTVNSRIFARIIRLLYPKVLICTDKPHHLERLQ